MALLKNTQAEYPAANIFQLLEKMQILSEKKESPVDIFLLTNWDLSSSEFGTNNSGGDCHIQRL